MLTLLINESKPLDGLFANATTGGIGSVPDISVADDGQAVSVQTFTRAAGVIADSFVAGDVLHIGIGDGVNTPVCYIALASASPATGTMAVNTVGMVALFAATAANQLSLQVGVVRTRGAYTNTIFSAPIVIHRSVIDPDTAVPTPSILGTGVAAALQVAINTALGFVRLDASARLPAVDGSQLINVPSSVSDGDKGEITVSNSGATWTIDNDTVTLAKLAHMTTARVVGRTTAGTGTPELLTISGTGSVAMTTSPTFVTPDLDTPSALVGTNISGTAASLTAGLVSSIGSLTGDVTSSNRATTLATVNANVGAFTNASLTVNAKGLVTAASSGTAAVTSITGTANEITVTGTTTPTLSLPSALTFTGKTVTGGTFNSGAFNGTVGATTPATGVFTSVTATGGTTSGVIGERAATSTVFLKGSDLFSTYESINIIPALFDGAAGKSVSILYNYDGGSNWTAALKATNVAGGVSNAVLNLMSAGGSVACGGTIELGHATDTTLARVSAGVVSIEGAVILVNGANAGTPSAIVLTNATGTAASLTAGNATKWTTGRTIALTGDVTYTSGALDGSGNVTGAATLANIPALSGANLTTLNASNISSGTLAAARLPSAGVHTGDATGTFPTITLNAAQTGITSVGTLTGGATGAGFTVALSTSTITGSLADARLSANVPLLNAANTWTAVNTFTPGARASGVASYLTVNMPADTGITAATESIGVNFAAGTRTWADGTVALQREHTFSAPTYNKTTTSAAFTFAINVDIKDPIFGTGVTGTKYALRAESFNVSGNSVFTGNISVIGTNQAAYFTDSSNSVAYAQTATDSTHAWTLVNRTSSKVPFSVQGAASQSADLQQWQNSSATVLAKVDSAGNLSTTGTLAVTGATTLGAGTSIKNIRHGVSGAMVAGVVTVTDTGCTANTRYFFTVNTIGTVAIPSTYYATTRTASTSFVVTASVLTDTSTLHWLAVEP